jgi:polysaccharide export outer membrane protein
MNRKRLLSCSVMLLGLTVGVFAQKSQTATPSSQPLPATPIPGVTDSSTTSGAGQTGTVPIYGVNTQAVQPTSSAQPSSTSPAMTMPDATAQPGTTQAQPSVQATPTVPLPGVATVPGTTVQTGNSATTAPAAPAAAASAKPATSTGPDSPQAAMTSMSSDAAQGRTTDAAPQQVAMNSTTSGVPQLAERHPLYKVNIGDQLNVKFEFLPNYSEATIDVQPDGYISLEGGVAPVYVLGDNVIQIEEKIRQAYKGIMKDPIVVTVELNSFLPPYFICWGEVMKPGKYEMKGDITLSQALGIAGGYNSMAKHSQIVLFRKVGDQWVSSQVINMKHMLYTHNLAEDMHLQAGDMIWVPQNTISKLINLEKVIPINTFRLDYLPPTN